MRLVKIRMKLGIPEKEQFSYHKSSLLQGVLMEWMDTEYAEKLHEGGRNPYAIHLEQKNKEWYWVVSIFEEEAVEKLFPVLLRKRDKFVLKHDNTEIAIKEVVVEESDTDKMLNQFYFQDAEKSIKIRFVTPTAFKQRGSYLFYPDIRCIYQSMISKYGVVSIGNGEVEEEMLEEMVQNTKILQYQLRSCNFHLEGVRIPAFIGEIKLGFRGAQTLTNYIHFLFRFAEYSGIGIKTAMGMGAIEVQENDKNKRA